MQQEVKLTALFQEPDAEESIAADLAVVGDNAGLLTIPDRCARCGKGVLVIDVYAICNGRLTVRVSGPHIADAWTTIPGRHAWTVDLHRCNGPTLP